MTVANHRTSEYPIDSMFLNRWSSRSFNKECITEEDLLTILDAAHWAPSSFNNQHWNFLYVLRDTEEWDEIFSILSEFNQSWVKNASALVVVFSEIYDKSGKNIYSHSFDAGCSWGFLALQASILGYCAHAMTGIDFQKAKSTLKYPESHRLEAIVAIGKYGSLENIPEFLKDKEFPNSRKALFEVCSKYSIKSKKEFPCNK
ncbi:nitroreductase family protein [Candidatus Liberibacter sp.]|uniref:nitroreductase family protein n=1 Tax=Candidatus Liberibacter sp. TaxID=34022 RepID=UPI0015F59AAB|nr:nitroreductase family protein [Candidatus Liberibacter sp.]MBA5723976.1 nitroreductase family protein [Candidatus Liberibacter sp.]